MTADGLDPAHIAAALPSKAARFRSVLPALEAHLKSHHGYVGWSGGKDSTVVVHLARTVNPDVPVCLFDSGLEYPENLAYMRRLADTWALNFHIIKAVPDALTVLQQSGAWNHQVLSDTSGPRLHDALITAPANEAVRRFGAGEITGLRAQESAARRALLSGRKGAHVRANGTRVLAPIWDWHDLDVTAYLAQHQIPENPVYTRLRELGASGKDLRVGLAFDGNNLQYGRVTWLRRGWPELYQQLEGALPRIREWR